MEIFKVSTSAHLFEAEQGMQGLHQTTTGFALNLVKDNTEITNSHQNWNIFLVLDALKPRLLKLNLFYSFKALKIIETFFNP